MATMVSPKKWRILGQDVEVLKAIWANVLSWLVIKVAPSLLPRLIPLCPAEVSEGSAPRETASSDKRRTRCVSIGRPGGLEQLRVVSLRDGITTVGYNLRSFCLPPFTPPLSKPEDIPSDCVILKNEAFSVNYADCTIRWGLYESAKRFVGWPIVPGFDIAGTIDEMGSNVDKALTAGGPPLQKGDRVFGVTLFGAYSDSVLVPVMQLRRIPTGLTSAEAASIPTVALTALHALALAGHFPNRSKYSNRSILIHSAAGGVGSMLVQMSKILGLEPVVGVVGSSTKVDEARSLGCDIVIDKSSEDLWKTAEIAAPNGFFTIMDANGVSTLQDSYDHLAQTGRLVVFGFHSNLPMGRAMLSPLEWIRMGKKMSAMPKFDPMDLTVDNRSVLGFNLSFFADEKDVVIELFDQICLWLEDKKLRCSRIEEMSMEQIGEAHELIQSGKSVGKIVIRT